MELNICLIKRYICMDIFGYEVSFLYLVLGVILLIVLTAGGFLSRSGLFYTITLRFSCPTPEVMPQRVAYIQAKGPYKNSGLLFRQTMDVSTNAKIFGIYYDDPSKVPKEELQYLVGCMLPSSDSTESDVLANHMEKFGYTIHSFPKCNNALISEFPNHTAISCFLAVWRVIPEMARMMEKRKYTEFPLIEVYTPSYIKFIVPVDNMAKFYVPGITRKQKTHVE